MVNCSRCCLNRSFRTVNLVVNFCGMAMIVYSLWLLKTWRDRGAAETGSASDLPYPWFIYTFMGVAIVVCLSTLSGHMVSNSLSITVLSVYILFVCSILLLQIGVIVEIFFRRNWEAVFSKDFENHNNLMKFFTFHLNICRGIGVAILFAQANAAMLAIFRWALGLEPTSHCYDSSSFRRGQSELDQSFLVRDSQPVLSGIAQFQRNLKFEYGEKSEERFGD